MGRTERDEAGERGEDWHVPPARRSLGPWNVYDAGVEVLRLQRERLATTQAEPDAQGNERCPLRVQFRHEPGELDRLQHTGPRRVALAEVHRPERLQVTGKATRALGVPEYLQHDADLLADVVVAHA